MKNNNERLPEQKVENPEASLQPQTCQEQAVWTETFLKKSRKGARKPEEQWMRVDRRGRWSVATGVRDSGSGRTHYVGDRGTTSAQAWMQMNK